MAKILLITEGKKPENRIIDSIRNYLGYVPRKKYDFVWGYWGAGILDLYDKLVQDEEQDYLPLLKKRAENQELQNYCVDDFGQIFLFFDFDPQSQTEKDKMRGKEKGVRNFEGRISEILQKCSDETSPFGKLFLSYPMIEAYLSFPYKFECSQIECYFDEHSSKRFAQTMHSINSSAAHRPDDLFWKRLLAYHLYKVCLFMGLDNNYKHTADMEQLDVYMRQQESRKKTGRYFAISPISLFMLSLYGSNFYDSLDFEKENLLCSCPCLN